MGAEEKKHLVIELARQQVIDGAHYLDSTCGNTAGKSDGPGFRDDQAQLHPNVPELVLSSEPRPKSGPPHAPMLFAAWAEWQGGLICCGRAAHKEVSSLPFAIDLKFKEALELTFDKITPEYMLELVESSDWPSSYRWPRPNSTLRKVPKHNPVLWGESCVGKRHFDCQGLMSYCMTKVLKKTFWKGMSLYYKSPFLVGSPVTAQPGDFLLRGETHIGIYTFSGTVIQAADATHGVVETPFVASEWTTRSRYPDSHW